MPIRREFLDWDRPALEAAVDYLFSAYRMSPDLVDLAPVQVVLSSRRAGRRLREVLLEQADRRSLALFPPRITTVGQLPESLYTPKRPFASQLIQQLAWARALRTSDGKRLGRVIADLPEADEHPRWLELGSLLCHQHRELAGDGLDFEKVSRLGTQLAGFREQARWRILAEVQKSYLGILDELGLWDRQTARLYAVEHRECAAVNDIVLLGAVDMNRTLRALLDQVAERVTALIYAPTRYADHFDAHGCLIPAAWENEPLAIADEQILLADGPASQADAVVKALADLDGRFAAQQITIGLPDESLVPHLETKLAQCKLPARWGPGRSLSASRPVLLLRAAADFVRERGFGNLAELARHPDVECWLGKRAGGRDALTHLDRHFRDHLPASVGSEQQGEKWPEAATGMRQLLAPLLDEPRSPADWVDALTDILVALYADQVLDAREAGARATLLACEQLHAALDALRDVPARLAPSASATTAILMLLGLIEQTDVPAVESDHAIELLGWLELPLDDAPALIVTGFCDGVVPQSVNADLFLPNRLRASLGIDDNRRRYARDAYALQVLLNARQYLRLIVPRRDAQGDPLRPSRLLFATDQESIVGRCLRFFDPGGMADARPVVRPAARAASAFCVPRPLPLAEPIDRLRVTDFRHYLECPYRFYLQRVLELRQVTDDADEIDAAAFGSLAHEVLHRFGRGACRDSTDIDEIRAYLNEQLDECVSSQFGPTCLATARVQVAQLRLRLNAFAARQADWRARGWRIRFVEESPPAGHILWDVDGTPVQLRGRIDRIDVHESTGAHAVLDYKTGDEAKLPDRIHRRQNTETGSLEWIDLQLPLYRHLVAAISIIDELKLGYVLLPKETGATSFVLAEQWTHDDLEEADEVARDVVRCIRRQEFWPPADRPPAFSEEVAAICQEGVFDRRWE